MEKVFCNHGKPCSLRYRTENEKYYYMCCQAARCRFKKESMIPRRVCSTHKAVIDTAVFKNTGKNEEIAYHCHLGDGWCGHWSVENIPGKENVDPQSPCIFANNKSGDKREDELTSKAMQYREENDSETNSTGEDSGTEEDNGSDEENSEVSNTREDSQGVEDDRVSDTYEGNELDDEVSDTDEGAESDEVSEREETKADNNSSVDESFVSAINETSMYRDTAANDDDSSDTEPSSNDNDNDDDDDDDWTPGDDKSRSCDVTPPTIEPLTLTDTIPTKPPGNTLPEPSNVLSSSGANVPINRPTIGANIPINRPGANVPINRPGANTTNVLHKPTYFELHSLQTSHVPKPMFGASVPTNRPAHQPSLPEVTRDEESDEEEKISEFKLGYQFRSLVQQLHQTQHLIKWCGPTLLDKGEKLRNQEAAIKKRMLKLRGYIPNKEQMEELLSRPSTGDAPPKVKQFSYGEARGLTVGAVEQLHQSGTTCPKDHELADTPPQLLCQLFEHQRRALKWLVWRESQHPSGGILADDMGLGKTLTMISLILSTRQDWKTTRVHEQDGLITSRGTLVVVPATLMNMWVAEIKSKVKEGVLSCYIYHGPSRCKDPRELAGYDVVVTTYAIVGTEVASVKGVDLPGKSKKRSSASNALFSVQFSRIILDEAHTVRNPKAALSIGCCLIKADHHWAMTGTPIQNNLKDFYSLIKFLRLAPFDDYRVWKDMIEKTRMGMRRLQTMVSALVLRRTKDETDLIKLPEKKVVVHDVELNDTERNIYDVIFSEGRGFFRRFLIEKGEIEDDGDDDTTGLADILGKLPHDISQVVQKILHSILGDDDDALDKGAKGRMVLVLLLRLRQCCSHPQLLTTALDTGSEDADLAAAMDTLSIEESKISLEDLPEIFMRESPSTKITCVMEQLKCIFASDKPGELPNKCIIVSQWVTMLDILRAHLIQNDISYTRIDGKVLPKNRQKCVDDFNTASPDPRVMLLSLQAGGVGISLTAANHVFIVDLHWNPQLEQQAADRCHRVGQTRDVVIHRFLTQNTVEVVIQTIQNKKLQLASDVLSGASKKQRKANLALTVADLKQLFEI